MKPHQTSYGWAMLRHYRRLWLIIGFIFFLCNLAPFSLDGIKSGFQESLDARLKSLLGSDLVISSRIPLELENIKKLAPAGSKSALVRSLYTMARGDKGSRSRLVSLSFVPASFPYYGMLVPRELGERFRTRPTALVWPELLALLDVKVGESIKIAGKSFEVIGLVSDDPGQVSQAQALAPKVYIDSKFLDELGLITKGSTVTYSLHFDFRGSKKSERESAVDALKKQFDSEGVQVRGPKENGEFVSRTVRIISNFLGLGNFLVVVLGLTAICFVLNKMFKREERTLRTYHQMGVPFSWVYLNYLKIFLFVSFLGALFSTSFALFLRPKVFSRLNELYGLSLAIPSSFPIGSFDQLVFILISTFLTFLFYTPIALVFLGAFYGKRQTLVRFSLLVCFAVLALLAFYWTNSFRLLAVMFGGGFGLVVIVGALSTLVLWRLEKFAHRLRAVYTKIWLGVLQLTRFKGHSLTTIILLALSIGVFGLIGTVSEGLSRGLLNDNDGNVKTGREKRPSMFLFDIQPEQIERLKEMTELQGASIRKLSPLVRARLTKINGRNLTQLSKESDDQVRTQEEERRGRFLKRGVNLSYQDRLYSSESIIKGANFFKENSGSDGEMKLSVEEDYADLLGVDLGSTMTFNVLGVDFQGVVSNIRQINWQSFDPNFFIVVSKGFLEDAPQTYVASLNVKKDQVTSLQNALFEELPNISSLNVRRVLQKVVAIISKVNGVFKIYGVFVLILGVVIIVSLLQLHWDDRLRDMEFFDLLGISSKSIVTIMLVETSVLILLALLMAQLFQISIGYFILVKIFEVNAFPINSIIENFWLCLFVLFALVSLLGFSLSRRNKFD